MVSRIGLISTIYALILINFKVKEYLRTPQLNTRGPLLNKARDFNGISLKFIEYPLILTRNKYS